MRDTRPGVETPGYSRVSLRDGRRGGTDMGAAEMAEFTEQGTHGSDMASRRDNPTIAQGFSLG